MARCSKNNLSKKKMMKMLKKMIKLKGGSDLEGQVNYQVAEGGRRKSKRRKVRGGAGFMSMFSSNNKSADTADTAADTAVATGESAEFKTAKENAESICNKVKTDGGRRRRTAKKSKTSRKSRKSRRR